MHSQVLVATTALLLGAVYAAPSTSSSTLQTRNAQPKCWYGADFPSQSDWLSFDTLFDNWKDFFASQGDTPQELETMKSALKKYSEQGGFNPALATAMMIQESRGNTCTKCGDGGVSCGLLQVKGSPKECENKAHPCPDSAIEKSIQCGTVGCGVEGNNIKNCVNTQGQKWGEVLRCYNTGSVKNPSDLRVASPGDPRYVHIIANILVGADYNRLQQLKGAECGF